MAAQLPSPLEASPRNSSHQMSRTAFIGTKNYDIGVNLAKRGPGTEVEISAPFGTGFPAFDFRRHDVYLVGYGLGLAFLGVIFYPMLGFGDAQYDPNAVT